MAGFWLIWLCHCGNDIHSRTFIMEKHEKDIVWEALVLIDAIEKNARSELDRLEHLALNKDIICIPRHRIKLIDSIAKIKSMLADIPAKKRPVMELLEMKYEAHS